MNTPEIKVGQKYRVVDAEGFGYSGINKGDVLTVRRFEDPDYWYVGEHVFMFPKEAADGTLELVEDVQEPTEASEDVSPAWASSVPEGVETHAQVSTGSSDDIIQAANTCVGLTRSSEDIPGGITMYRNGEPMNRSSGMSGELLWKFIEGSSEYNEHKQLELKEMSLEQLKSVVRILEQYIEDHVDTTATCLDIRLMYTGDHIGGWGASVHQLNYWSAGEHPSGHLDKLLFSVEKVIGI